jgi:murein DD-endopeptidase MepM/ murein hydrolase activator NlpD
MQWLYLRKLSLYISELTNFCKFLSLYLKKKIEIAWIFFERNKNILVRLFIVKRGRYNRPFLHLSTMGVLGIGVVLSPFLADTFPIFSSKAYNSLEDVTVSEASIIVGENVFETNISKKPRDKIITYTVQRGDTLSTVAEKFSSPDNPISIDTVRWANDLTGDDLSIGDELKILPVSGIAHKVSNGDTVYEIAKKYSTDAQRIVDFPFNDFANPETFSLVVGQILIVPDGVMPSAAPAIRRQVYIAQGPTSFSSAGFTWPIYGAVSQFASWYHMAIDITAEVGSPIVSAQDGTVTGVNVGTWDGGYGTSVWVDNGQGFATHYAHLGGVNVGIGDTVVAGGTVIGWIGMTGRTTGPHVHFELSKNGVLVNPLSYLQ